MSREIRKIFSQELGIAPKELHKDGTELQLKVGSSTGMNALVVKDNIEFVDEDTNERTGLSAETSMSLPKVWPPSSENFTPAWEAAHTSLTPLAPVCVEPVLKTSIYRPTSAPRPP